MAKRRKAKQMAEDVLEAILGQSDDLGASTVGEGAAVASEAAAAIPADVLSSIDDGLSLLGREAQGFAANPTGAQRRILRERVQRLARLIGGEKMTLDSKQFKRLMEFVRKVVAEGPIDERKLGAKIAQGVAATLEGKAGGELAEAVAKRAAAVTGANLAGGFGKAAGGLARALVGPAALAGAAGLGGFSLFNFIREQKRQKGEIQKLRAEGSTFDPEPSSAVQLLISMSAANPEFSDLVFSDPQLASTVAARLAGPTLNPRDLLPMGSIALGGGGGGANVAALAEMFGGR